MDEVLKDRGRGRSQDRKSSDRPRDNSYGRRDGSKPRRETSEGQGRAYTPRPPSADRRGFPPRPPSADRGRSTYVQRSPNGDAPAWPTLTTAGRDRSRERTTSDQTNQSRPRSSSRTRACFKCHGQGHFIADCTSTHWYHRDGTVDVDRDQLEARKNFGNWTS